MYSQSRMCTVMVLRRDLAAVRLGQGRSLEGGMANRQATVLIRLLDEFLSWGAVATFSSPMRKRRMNVEKDLVKDGLNRL